MLKEYSIRNDESNFPVCLLYTSNSGDKIVIEGVQNLKDGQKVQPITPAQKEANYQQHLKDQHDGNLATAFN